MQRSNCRTFSHSLICVVIIGIFLPDQRSCGEEPVSAHKRTIVSLNGVIRNRDVRPNHLGDRYVEIGCLLKLEPGDEFQFTTTSEYAPFIYVTTPGRPRRLVGVKVESPSGDDDRTWKNALSSLSKEEIHGLWGLSLDHWSDEIAGQLEQLNFDHVCLTIYDGVLGSYEFREQSPLGLPLPVIPERITDLVIQILDPERGLSNLDGLRRLTKLRSSTAGNIPFDCNWLVNSTELRSLSLDWCRPLKNTNALSSLIELRELRVSSCYGLFGIEFVKPLARLRLLDFFNTDVTDLNPTASLTDLESLGLAMTRVEDLSPLTGLPKLTEVQVSGSHITRLPDRIPHLRNLSAMTCRVTDIEASLFRTQNPHCNLVYSWNESLRSLLSDSIELQVHSRSWTRSDMLIDEILFQTRNVAELRELIAGLRLVESESAMGCGCANNLYLDFLDEDHQVTSISLNHGEHLRHRIWPGDAYLTPESSQFLVHWLADRNVKGPLREWQDSERFRRSLENKK